MGYSSHLSYVAPEDLPPLEAVSLSVPDKASFQFLSESLSHLEGTMTVAPILEQKGDVATANDLCLASEMYYAGRSDLLESYAHVRNVIIGKQSLTQSELDWYLSVGFRDLRNANLQGLQVPLDIAGIDLRGAICMPAPQESFEHTMARAAFLPLELALEQQKRVFEFQTDALRDMTRFWATTAFMPAAFPQVWSPPRRGASPRLR